MKKVKIPPPPPGVPDNIAEEDLYLDTRNPRLAEYGISPNENQEEVLQILWNKMAVDEVAMSIAASGYWNYEPLFVAKENGHDVVVEGNRRLAAVRVLRHKALQKKLNISDLPEMSDAAEKSLAILPVVRVAKREDVWRYLGFKHVNGPAKWRSYAKANYISFIVEKTGQSLVDIAAQLGDAHRTVQRLYRALMVIEQAEKTGVYKREYAFKKQLAFSHLTTALEYEGFATFLGLKKESEESPEPVAPGKIKELGELCRWLWGDNRDDTPSVIESQNPNLRQLEQVVRNKPALATLRAGQGLAVAYEVSKGDDVVFSDSLQEAKNALVKAQGRVSSGYNGEPSLLAMAQTISEMANDLVTVMESKANELRPKKRVTKAK